MPNQRSKDKVAFGGYIDRELKREITRLAQEAGMDHNHFGFVMGLVRPLLESHRLTRERHAPRHS